VTLRAGENITDFKVELTPASTIRGRVVDEYGDPLVRARVQIEAASQYDPSFSMQVGGSFAQTNDRGEFAVTGLPGKYSPNCQARLPGAITLRPARGSS
jgi:hypothetical protein